MNKTQKTLIIVGLLLIIAIGYIFNERYIKSYIDERELAINNSYASGFNKGIEQWNAQVIYGVNNNGIIPYWFNGSYFELNINQLCGQ